MELRTARYDVHDAIERGRRESDPRAELIAELLLHPRSVAEVIAECEELVFSD